MSYYIRQWLSTNGRPASGGAASSSAKPKPAEKRRRSRHPAGNEKAGQFIADDPATPQDEAWEGAE